MSALTAEEKQVLARISPDELKKLALELSNIDSPAGEEGAVGEFIFGWCSDQGFETQKLGLLSHRFNVVAVLPGRSRGFRSLAFNSHMDTWAHKNDNLVWRSPADPKFHTAWEQGGILYGEGIINDKGPMAAFMMACKAIKDANIPLRGDLIQTMVAGEIGREPIEEFQGNEYISKELGARYAIQHGPVPDFCVVAEGTDFTLSWIECGKAFFRVTVYGDSEQAIYTPYMPDRTTLEASPNAIVRAARVIDRIEAYAKKYQELHTYRSPGGLCVPKICVGAIRGGHPYMVIQTSQLCHLYLDCRLNPKQNPLEVKEGLEGVLEECGVQGRVEQFLYRRGYEAQGIEPLSDMLTTCHEKILGNAPKEPHPGVCSMWRDHNIYNEMGIPALTYGPPRSMLRADKAGYSIDDLLRCSQIYALTALAVCNSNRAKNSASTH